MNKIVIEYLFPEISNLYGDPFNVKFLAGCVRENKAECDVITDSLNEEPFFARINPDVIYIGPMTEHSQELAIDRLAKYKDRIAELIKSGTMFLVTGNAIEIFIKGIECEDGKFIPGLDLYPYIAKRKMFARYNSLFLGEFRGIKIVGNKSQFTHCYGESGDYNFISVTRGDGLCPGNPNEGISDNNFMATYLLGPLLPLNPEFTRNILTRLGIDNPVILYEKEAVKAYEIRLKEFENPETELA